MPRRFPTPASLFRPAAAVPAPPSARPIVRWPSDFDWEPIARLERLSFGAQRWRERAIVDFLDSGTTLGYVADMETPTGRRVLAGYALARKRPGGRVELLRLGVDPAWWGRGVATALIDRLVVNLAPGGSLGLSVRETNARAIRLYARLGFRALGLIRDHYEDPREDAIRFAFWRPDPFGAATA